MEQMDSTLASAPQILVSYRLVKSLFPDEFEKKLNVAAADGWKLLSVNVIDGMMIGTMEKA